MIYIYIYTHHVHLTENPLFIDHYILIKYVYLRIGMWYLPKAVAHDHGKHRFYFMSMSIYIYICVHMFSIIHYILHEMMYNLCLCHIDSEEYWWIILFTVYTHTHHLIHWHKHLCFSLSCTLALGKYHMAIMHIWRYNRKVAIHCRTTTSPLAIHIHYMFSLAAGTWPAAQPSPWLRPVVFIQTHSSCESMRCRGRPWGHLRQTCKEWGKSVLASIVDTSTSSYFKVYSS